MDEKGNGDRPVIAAAHPQEDQDQAINPCGVLGAKKEGHDSDDGSDRSSSENKRFNAIHFPSGRIKNEEDFETNREKNTVDLEPGDGAGVGGVILFQERSEGRLRLVRLEAPGTDIPAVPDDSPPVEKIYSFRPCGPRLVDRVVQVVDHRREGEFEADRTGARGRPPFREGPGIVKLYGFVLPIGIGRVGLPYVNEEKFNPVPVFPVEGLDSSRLPPEGSSGMGAEDEKDRLSFPKVGKTDGEVPLGGGKFKIGGGIVHGKDTVEVCEGSGEGETFLTAKEFHPDGIGHENRAKKEIPVERSVDPQNPGDDIARFKTDPGGGGGGVKGIDEKTPGNLVEANPEKAPAPLFPFHSGDSITIVISKGEPHVGIAAKF